MPEFAVLPDGGRLAYEVAGAGPPLLLVHGFSMDRRMWRAMLPDLTARHTVVMTDLRGFGQSDTPRGPYTHAGDLVGLLDALGIARVAVAGLSLGGGVAIELALNHPDRVSALIAIDAILEGFPWTIDWDLKVKTRTLDEIRRAWLASELLAWPSRDPVIAEQMTEMVNAYSGWHWRNRNPLIRAERPAMSRLAEITTPTLALVGERDHADFRAIATLLAAEISGARLSTLPGVGHLPPLEAPGAIARAILDFLYVRTP